MRLKNGDIMKTTAASASNTNQVSKVRTSKRSKKSPKPKKQMAKRASPTRAKKSVSKASKSINKIKTEDRVGVKNGGKQQLDTELKQPVILLQRTSIVQRHSDNHATAQNRISSSYLRKPVIRLRRSNGIEHSPESQPKTGRPSAAKQSKVQSPSKITRSSIGRQNAAKKHEDGFKKTPKKERAGKQKTASPGKPKESLAVKKGVTKKTKKSKIKVAGLLANKSTRILRKQETPFANGTTSPVNKSPRKAASISPKKENITASPKKPRAKKTTGTSNKVISKSPKQDLRRKITNLLKAEPALTKQSRKKTKVASLNVRMMTQLASARFRFINEELYSKDSGDAAKMFKDDPDAFTAYHNGYRQQVAKWPLNPLDKIITSLKKMPANAIIADFGCGDAVLAKSIKQKVHSFDLVAANDDVVACDMSKVPLANESVDVAVFCLSLMGTNLRDYVLEANRVLKVGGMLKIAEVESRFDKVDTFIAGVARFGFENTHKNLEHNLFHFMDFRKSRSVKNKKNLPTISLLPCLYKKR